MKNLILLAFLVFGCTEGDSEAAPKASAVAKKDNKNDKLAKKVWDYKQVKAENPETWDKEQKLPWFCCDIGDLVANREDINKVEGWGFNSSEFDIKLSLLTLPDWRYSACIIKKKP